MLYFFIQIALHVLGNIYFSQVFRFNRHVDDDGLRLTVNAFWYRGSGRYFNSFDPASTVSGLIQNVCTEWRDSL